MNVSSDVAVSMTTHGPVATLPGSVSVTPNGPEPPVTSGWMYTGSKGRWKRTTTLQSLKTFQCARLGFMELTVPKHAPVTRIHLQIVTQHLENASVSQGTPEVDVIKHAKTTLSVKVAVKDVNVIQSPASLVIT